MFGQQQLQLALIFATRLVSVAKFTDGETPIPHIDWNLFIVAPWVQLWVALAIAIVLIIYKFGHLPLSCHLFENVADLREERRVEQMVVIFLAVQYTVVASLQDQRGTPPSCAPHQ